VKKLTDVNKVGIFITVFVVLILGLVLIDSIGDQVYLATNLGSLVNESVVITAGAGQLAQDDVDTLSYFGNNSNDTSAFINTLINYTKAGVITTDPTVGNTTYNASYTYEGDEYIVGSNNRVLIRLIIIFFAIAVLAAALWGMYQMGILELFNKK